MIENKNPKVVYMCRSCSKRHHNSCQEQRLCELYHKEELTAEEIFEYVNLRDTIRATRYIQKIMEPSSS